MEMFPYKKATRWSKSAAYHGFTGVDQRVCVCVWCVWCIWWGRWTTHLVLLPREIPHLYTHNTSTAHFYSQTLQTNCHKLQLAELQVHHFKRLYLISTFQLLTWEFEVFWQLLLHGMIILMRYKSLTIYYACINDQNTILKHQSMTFISIHSPPL